MRLKGFIQKVGPLYTGTNAEGKPWQRRTLTLAHMVTLDNGKQVNEQILADYFGDATEDELLALAADSITLDLTLWFSVRDYADRETGVLKQYQTIVLKSLSRSI